MPMPSESSEPRSCVLQPSELHSSVHDPSLGAVKFLNEIMQRHPKAISFAPGAPYPVFLESLDVQGYLDVFAQRLKAQRSFSSAQVQRLLHQYGPSKGLINDLVAELLLNDEELAVGADSIVITVGCQEAMMLVLRALRSGPNDQLAVVTPCYVGLIGAARLVDFDLVAIDESDDGLDLPQLKRACRDARASGKRIKALYVAPDHSNPSGTHMPEHARVALLALAAEHDFLVIEDSTYRFTSAGPSPTALIKSLDREHRVILLGTFAKTCTPGARVGYVVADQPIGTGRDPARILADELASLKTMVTVNTSPLCQALIGGMLVVHDCSIKRLATEKVRRYQGNLDRLLAALDEHLGDFPQVSWNRPSGGFFVRVRLPIPVDEALVARSAEEFGVLWTPMSHFHIDGAMNYELRLSCSYLAEDQIDQGVRRLSRFLRTVVSPVREGVACDE
jgi:(S)-3,5-dihydroxyphenylglycine transaminase